MRLERAIAALLLVAALPCTGQPDSRVSIEAAPPRAHSYFVGDRIERIISIDAGAFDLIDADLPQPGPVNRWFELVDRELRAGGADGPQQLRLVYQLRNSADEAQVVELPAVSLQLRGERTLVRTVAGAPIFVAPLLPRAAEGSTLAAPRPDAAPPPLDAATPRRNAVAWLALAAAAGAAWLALLLLQRRHPRPFARALHELRRLRHHPPDAQITTAALRLLHRAFDQTAGRVVIARDLDAVFGSRPDWPPLRETTFRFFAASERRFYAAAGEVAPPLDELIALARAWHSAEAAA